MKKEMHGIDMTLVTALPLVIDFFYQLFLTLCSLLTVNLPIDLIVACMHGYYGKNCIKTCGNCLINQTCNNVNGTCIYGCSEGFKGDLCITSTVQKEPRFKDSCVSNLNEWYTVSFDRRLYVRISYFWNKYFFIQSILKSNKKNPETLGVF